MRRWVRCAVVGLLLASCGGRDTAEPPTSDTSDTTSASTTTTRRATTTAPTATSIPTTAAPGSPVTLLVADDAGLRLWSEDGTQEWLVHGQAMQGAVADRAGGVIYQQAETGMFHMVFDPPGGFEGAVSWEWTGDGAPRPIRHLGADGVDAVVVEPTRGQILRLVDTALVGGRLQVAYLRSTHQLEPVPIVDTGTLNASRTTELVVRDAATARESVAWSVENAWESGSYRSKLGGSALGDATLVTIWLGYAADTAYLSLSDVSGSPLPMSYRPPEQLASCWPDPLMPADSWCVETWLRADLAPDGAALAYAVVDPPGIDVLTIASLDPATWTEQARASVPTVHDAMPAAVDAADGRVLVSLVASQPTTPPTLRRGDTGAWVRLLQSSLFVDDVPIVPDGVFGPKTEAAVVRAQQRAGLEPTGIVDAATWSAVSGPSTAFTWLPAVLVERDGTTRAVVVPGTGEPATEFEQNGVARVTIWAEPPA